MGASAKVLPGVLMLMVLVFVVEAALAVLMPLSGGAHAKCDLCTWSKTLTSFSLALKAVSVVGDIKS